MRNVACDWSKSWLYVARGTCSLYNAFMMFIVKKYIKMGMKIFKFFIRVVYHRIYGWKSCFTAPLTSVLRQRKTKFPTVYPTIYHPKLKV